MNTRELEVMEILKTLTPAMEADGGGIELVSVKNNVVTVKFKGACLICPSIGMTFTLGIVKTLKESLPWITSIIKAN